MPSQAGVRGHPGNLAFIRPGRGLTGHSAIRCRSRRRYVPASTPDLGPDRGVLGSVAAGGLSLAPVAASQSLVASDGTVRGWGVGEGSTFLHSQSISHVPPQDLVHGLGQSSQPFLPQGTFLMPGCVWTGLCRGDQSSKAWHHGRGEGHRALSLP